MNAVEVSGLSKAFGTTRAVDGLDLKVAEGEVYGFLGRNGAGKTTTIRLLLGMLAPDSGTVQVLGQRVRRDSGPWGRVGSLVETATAWPDLSVTQNLRTLADLHCSESRRRIPELIDLLELGPLAHRRSRDLSLGNRQRLALAMALLPDPDLLILDEPINGLDPAGVVQVRELLVSRAKTHGTTVFVSSHLLDEVARTCTRIGILHQGRLVEELNRSDLDRLVSHKLLVTSPDGRARSVLEAAGLPVRPGPSPLTWDLGNTAPELVAPLLVAQGVALTELRVMAEDLEDYFLRRTEDRA